MSDAPLQFPALSIGQPRKPAMADPITAKIVAELERYVEGELMTDTQKREVIAAYVSGMMFAVDIVIPKKKEGVVLPVFLRRKIIDLAKTLGMVPIGTAKEEPKQ